MSAHWSDDQSTLYLGDCLDVLPALADRWTGDRIDALFGFNGMASHWTATASKLACVPTPGQWAVLRDAIGFDDTEILALVEQLAARKGEPGEDWARREVLGHRLSGMHQNNTTSFFSGVTGRNEDGSIPVTAPASDAATRWDGWNTQLKPAHEPIVLARKSTGCNTTAANVLEHATGALHVNACRTESAAPSVPQPAFNSPTGRTYAMKTGEGRNGERSRGDLGRWPTNVVLSHSPQCVQTGERTVRGDARSGQDRGTRPGHFAEPGAEPGDPRPNGPLHGDQAVPVFACAPGCPAAELDRQSGVLASGANPARRGSNKFRTVYGSFPGQRECGPARSTDSGGASRFFPVFRYEAKAPACERPRLADGTTHNTVKPLALMQWLVRLVTPPGGTVLDPFAGSGTTLEACLLEGFRAIGVERDPGHADLCVARLTKPIQAPLFGAGGDAT